MRTVSVEKFEPMVAVYADNCPNFVIRRAVVEAVNDICRRTGCVVTTSKFSTKPGEAHYEFYLPHGLKAESVRRMYCDGVRVQEATLDGLAKQFVNDYEEAEGDPKFYFFRKPYRIQLVPRPTQEHLVRMDITVSVEPDTVNVPEIFYTEMSDLVVYGALARILAIVGQPFSNSQQAEAYRQKYAVELLRVKSEAMQGFQRTNGRVFYNRII